jgi:hypothetical protein
MSFPFQDDEAFYFGNWYLVLGYLVIAAFSMLNMIHKARNAMPRPENVPDKMEAAESAG